MKLHTQCIKHSLQFKFRAGTSRGFMDERDTYFIVIQDPESSVMGIGESSPLQGLSQDDQPNFADHLQQAVNQVPEVSPPESPQEISQWLDLNISSTLPSIRFGLETAWLDFLQGGQRKLFPSVFQSNQFPPIPINGLVWMGNREFMLHQIRDKISRGFRCIKLKIGAIDFDTELSLLAHIREHFSSEQMTIRVDANGAFTENNAMEKLKALAPFHLHSIEQPVATHQPALLRHLCEQSPVPIALDEELIGIHEPEDQAALLDSARPQYIVLKPTLVGGLAASEQWIRLAEERGIGWWMTSALESNVGLNAIAQFTAFHQATQPQGLGTGQLYHNNIPSPIAIRNGYLHYDAHKSWDLSLLDL
uniref:O-succinylbenzoate synthase n=1 Tax=Roseihalotalea indica TaxID=2867963 RepID=A0AA49GJZ5_9BACT|nr:o-succinylbenzoate synthase [Tunicatimonas sp. TK19036]